MTGETGVFDSCMGCSSYEAMGAEINIAAWPPTGSSTGAHAMVLFEIVIGLLLVGAGLAAFARHIGTPYPALVALAGAALAVIPGTPTLVLNPELALALFVAPV